MNTKTTPFERDHLLDTDSLMKKMGITREEANAILWELFDKESFFLPLDLSKK